MISTDINSVYPSIYTADIEQCISDVYLCGVPFQTEYFVDPTPVFELAIK